MGGKPVKKLLILLAVLVAVLSIALLIESALAFYQYYQSWCYHQIIIDLINAPHSIPYTAYQKYLADLEECEEEMRYHLTIGIPLAVGGAAGIASLILLKKRRFFASIDKPL